MARPAAPSTPPGTAVEFSSARQPNDAVWTFSYDAWAPDLRLVGTHWSPLGEYRNGSSIGFDGVQSHAIAPHHEVFGWLKRAITIGMVVHRVSSTPADGGSAASETPATETATASETLAAKGSLFSLSIAADRLVWKVATSGGQAVQATGKTALRTGVAYIVKACFDATPFKDEGADIVGGEEVHRETRAACKVDRRPFGVTGTGVTGTYPEQVICKCRRCHHD